MYISSTSMQAGLRTSIMNAQSELANGQTELASGTYADLGTALGASSSRLLSFSDQQTRLAGYKSGNVLAGTRLTSTSTALTSLQATATTFLSAVAAAGTAGGSYTGLQQTAGNSLTGLVASLNTTINGDAVFGGINTATTPVTSYAAGSTSKAAVDAAFLSAFGFSQSSPSAASITAAQMTTFLQTNFAALFSATSYKTTWSTASDQTQSTQIAPGQSIASSVSANADAMRALAQAYTMVSEFTGSNFSTAAQQAATQASSAVISQAIDGLTDLQAGVGVSQNALSSANDQITTQTSMFDTLSGDMQDVDPYTLKTRIDSLQTQIQASYSLTNQLKQLSLVNYLTGG